jgi:hypothetical protein
MERSIAQTFYHQMVQASYQQPDMAVLRQIPQRVAKRLLARERAQST